MAGNTKCYRVTLGADGALQTQVVEFSPHYADRVDAALERLRNADILGPPIVRFGDYAELARRWAEGEGV